MYKVFILILLILKEIFTTETVYNINKRSLGKLILKYCGNEGNVENEHQKSLRGLLQAVIDHLEKEHSMTWRNAEINIYDIDNHALKIRSGRGGNSFVVQYKGDTEEVEIVNVKRESSMWWRLRSFLFFL